MKTVRWQRIVSEGIVIAVAIVIASWAWHANLHWFERHSLPRYCAATRGESVLVTVVRAIALVCALLLIVVVRPRVDRWIASWTLGGSARIAVAVLAAVGVFALWFRGRPHRDATAVERTDMPHAVLDARLGWRFTPSQTFRTHKHGRMIEYAIDARGNRAASADAPFDPDAPTLLVAGESIAFGESVPWSESLPGTLAADLHVQVVTVGVPAYGFDQAYLRMEDALAEIHHPIAVVTIVLPQELRRTNTMQRPGLELRDGVLVERGPEHAMSLAVLWREEPYRDDTALTLARAIIEATIARAREHGTRALFVMTNYGPPCSDGDDAWIAQALLGGTPHVNVTLLPDEAVGAPDFHPNAAGARRLADAIEAAISRRP